MRRFQTLLMAVGLAAAPLSASADPKSQTYEVHEFSTAKGRLGAMVMSLTSELRDYFGVAHDRGVLVASVEPNTPAATVGLRAGDVIVEIDGKAVAHAADVIDAIGKLPKGKQVGVAIVRSRAPMTLRPTLVDDPLPATMTDRDKLFDPNEMFREFEDMIHRFERQHQHDQKT